MNRHNPSMNQIEYYRYRNKHKKLFDFLDGFVAVVVATLLVGIAAGIVVLPIYAATQWHLYNLAWGIVIGVFGLAVGVGIFTMLEKR